MLATRDATQGDLRLTASWRELLRRAFAIDTALALTGLGMVALALFALAALVADPRVLTGAPLWLKPLKFAVSTAIYCFTFLWLLSYVRGRPRLVRVVAVGTAWFLAIEIGLIVFQAARGVISHFNVATPFDAFLYDRMRDAIIAVATLNLVAIVLLVRQRLVDRVFGAALRGGLGLSLAGMLTGVLMTAPTPATQDAFGNGRSGAHSIGVADGGPGLPIVGWSTTGGDMRIAHFAGLHAMQLLPLLAWVLARPRFDRLGAGGRLAIVRIVGLAYFGLIVLLAWQALRGQSIVAPDTTTLAAFGALYGAAALAILAVVARARRATA